MSEIQSRTFFKDQPTKIVLLVHGFNVKPSAMEPLGDYLSQQGYTPRIVSLRGHSHSDQDWREIGTKRWVEDVAEAYRQARRETDQVYYIGYSMGGLLFVHLLAQVPDAEIKKAVLLAPAISIAKYLIPLLALACLLPKNLPLLSILPRRYSARRIVTAGWYATLGKLHTEMKFLKPISAPDVAIVMSEADELVSASGIRVWLKGAALTTKWPITPLFPKPVGHTIQHLIVDDYSLGAQEWQRMCEYIKNFFGGVPN